MNLNIDGVATAIDDSDIVKFTSTQLGSSTAGEFELFFDGSEFGLTEDNQDIDGLQLLEDGSLLISFLGSTTSLIDGLLVSDEDILRVQPNATETEKAGTWLTYLDGSDLNLNLTNGGDIQGFTLTPLGDLHFSTVGESLVVDNAGNEVSANAADILSYSPTNLGLVTEGIVANSLVFEGDASELTTEKIDAISTENLIDLE